MSEEDRRHLPSRRQADFEHLDEKIDLRFDDLTAKIARFIRKSLVGFIVLGLACTLALIGFGVSLGRIKDTRKDFVYDSCTAQNKRHDNTVTEFYTLAERAKKKYPKMAAQIDDSVESNLRLIDALAPKLDCKKLSEVAVGDANPPPPAVTTKEKKTK